MIILLFFYSNRLDGWDVELKNYFIIDQDYKLSKELGIQDASIGGIWPCILNVNSDLTVEQFVFGRALGQYGDEELLRFLNTSEKFMDTLNKHGELEIIREHLEEINMAPTSFSTHYPIPFEIYDQFLESLNCFELKRNILFM